LYTSLLLPAVLLEEHREERFKKLLKEVEAGTVFKKGKEVYWVCRECGYVHYRREHL